MSGKLVVRTIIIFISIIYFCLPTAKALVDSTRPSPPIGAPRMLPGQDPNLLANQNQPSKPQPTIIDPSTIYNDSIVTNLPQQSIEASSSAVDGPSVLPKVTNIANGGRLSYPNVPKPHPCVDFNNQSKWRSDGAMAHFAGWGAFAVDDGGFYRDGNVFIGFDASIGNGLSAKISSNQPYAAGFASPLIQIKAGDRIVVKVRYLISNIGLDSVAYDWASLGVKPDAKSDKIRYVNGYTRGQWAEMENTIVAMSGQIMILLQAHSPAALNSAIYFDDLEIFINQVGIKSCEN